MKRLVSAIVRCLYFLVFPHPFLAFRAHPLFCLQGHSGRLGGSGDLQALSVDAALIARGQKMVTASSGLTVGVTPSSSDGG